MKMHSKYYCPISSRDFLIKWDLWEKYKNLKKEKGSSMSRGDLIGVFLKKKKNIWEKKQHAQNVLKIKIEKELRSTLF